MSDFLDPDRIAISPQFRLSKLLAPKCSLQDKIDVFEDQIKGWIFAHAAALVGDSYSGREHSGIAVLMLASSYFEMIGAFLAGKCSKGKEGVVFKSGFREAFPDLVEIAQLQDPDNAAALIDQVATFFYKQLRCGLFHEAMIGGRVVIQAQPYPVSIVMSNATKPEIAYITIDPKAFLERIHDHFNSYVNSIRGAADLERQRNFETFWDLRRARPGPRIVDHAPHVRLGLLDITGGPPGTTHMHGKPNPKPEA